MKIITDSACDLTLDEAKALNVEVIPLKVRFGMEEFLDGVTISREEFFARLAECEELPTTSQITPYEFTERFGEGEEVVYISLSSKLSGTYQSAMIAKGDREDVYVVDSLNAALGQRLIVEYAARLRDEGKSAKEIVDILENKKRDVRLYALLNTLENLRKGGRIPSSVAAIGTLLVIKPIVTVVEGEVVMSGKARGAKNGRKIMHECIMEDGPIDFDLPYTFAYSGTNPENLLKYVEEYQDYWKKPIEELPVMNIGAIIGTHVGPNACAFAYFKK